jgi:hypothetical protein
MPDRPSTVAVRAPATDVPDAAVANPGLWGRLLSRLRWLARFAYDLLTHSP